MSASHTIDRRILVVAPTGADAQNTLLVLEKAAPQGFRSERLPATAPEVVLLSGILLEPLIGTFWHSFHDR